MAITVDPDSVRLKRIQTFCDSGIIDGAKPKIIRSCRNRQELMLITFEQWDIPLKRLSNPGRHIG